MDRCPPRHNILSILGMMIRQVAEYIVKEAHFTKSCKEICISEHRDDSLEVIYGYGIMFMPDVCQYFCIWSPIPMNVIQNNDFKL